MTTIQLFIGALTLLTNAFFVGAEFALEPGFEVAPVPTALLLGPPLVAVIRILRPLAFGINAFANTLLKLLRVEPKNEVEAVFTDDQLARMVMDSSQAGLLSAADGERLRDALELGTRPVGEILVPAARMRTVADTVTPASLERVAAQPGYSRFPVTGGSQALLGYLHIKDALGVADRDEPFPRTVPHPLTRVSIDTRSTTRSPRSAPWAATWPLSPATRASSSAS
ncbi:hypothetical protein SMD44_07778 [Streptomyces alboflavus]|uniref:CNNM transmembrane domain-containing protein n=1 Tax=Streptomyces alboflavus TaxID=67267 RepID=A0A1Z1WPA5_9ACTN|nr:hypothetical protein SMD44_07778 [Streptomyces alboflavus]